ncbi:MAG: hypothetical protein WD794_14700 [Mycobacteriales bacterium]
MTAALLAAALLSVLHLAAPRIRRLPLVPEHVTASFAGGVAVAYVFLHLLPELSEGNARVREVLDEQGGQTPLLGLEVFAVALLGFLVFYGLQRLAESRRPESDGPVFAVHLGSYALYNAILGYTLPLTWRTSVAFAGLFTLAMGLHFVLTDRGLEEHYGRRFDRWPPRIVLAGAVLAGCALAAVLAPTSTTLVSVLVAFLAGSVLLNVFKEEIPSARRSHFGWFATGLVLYAVLLAAVTASEEVGEGGVEAAGQLAAHPAGVPAPSR